MYLFASWLAAAALDGSFEHPARCSPVDGNRLAWSGFTVLKGFFNSLLVGHLVIAESDMVP
jgi:hypothetical protein